MTSSLRIKNRKLTNLMIFRVISIITVKTDVFSDVIYLNHCEPRRPNDASGGHKVSGSRTAQTSEARLLRSLKTNKYFAQNCLYIKSFPIFPNYRGYIAFVISICVFK